MSVAVVLWIYAGVYVYPRSLQMQKQMKCNMYRNETFPISCMFIWIVNEDILYFRTMVMVLSVDLRTYTVYYACNWQHSVYCCMHSV